MAADLITTAFKRKFSDTFRELAQQKESKTQSRVEVITVDADLMYIDHVGKRSEAAPQTSLIQATNLIEHAHTRRILKTLPYPDAIPLSKQALVRLIADPTYKYIDQQMAMYNRLKDKLVFTAALAAVDVVSTDVFTASTTSLGAGQIYTEAGTVGMTAEKIATARKVFNDNDLDGVKAYLALAPQAILDLSLDPDVTMVDQMALDAVRNGEVRQIFGFEVIMSNQLAIASNIRHNVAWVEAGLALGLKGNGETDIAPRPDLNNLIQILTSMELGAIRLMEEGVYDIQAYEA